MKTYLKICIIDEQDDGESISGVLKSEFTEFEFSLHSCNIEEASFYLDRNTPDILFLNLGLVDERAVKMFSKFRKNLSQIIFITDSEANAIEAIKRGITDYLLKPIKKLDFVIAVNKALESINKQKNFIYHSTFHSKINIPTLQGFKRISIHEIIRCEADSNYTFIYLLDKTKVIVSKTLHDFEMHLSEYNFFRIHHKHLINLDHLKEYIKGRGGQVIMADNSILDVAARKKTDFLYRVENIE